MLAMCGFFVIFFYTCLYSTDFLGCIFCAGLCVWVGVCVCVYDYIYLFYLFIFLNITSCVYAPQNILVFFPFIVPPID